ncbi:hypothetical protein PPS11_22809 [Pseudomonas putida S11]|nr:hypothetical protein PPS11_22809 [Pseudomonas putida S11]
MAHPDEDFVHGGPIDTWIALNQRFEWDSSKVIRPHCRKDTIQTANRGAYCITDEDIATHQSSPYKSG